MSLEPISKVAKQFGLRSSALRYYERIGLLPPARIVSGKRHYDAAILDRLAIVQRARSAGFSLADIAELLSGFSEEVPASRRWRELTRRKHAELEAAAKRIHDMQDLLDKMSRCGCEGVEICGRKIRTKGPC